MTWILRDLGPEGYNSSTVCASENLQKLVSLSALPGFLKCEFLVCFSYSRYVSQRASCEAFGQKTLEVGRPLNGEQEQLHLDLLRACSHDFSKLRPWKTQKTSTLSDYIPSRFPRSIPPKKKRKKSFSLLEMVPINVLFNTPFPSGPDRG